MAKTKKRATEQIRVLPENEIYVGAFSYHPCSQEGVHPVYCLGVFEDCHGHSLLFKLECCPKCGALYFPWKTYQKHWGKLGRYTFIQAKTGKLTSETLICRRPKKQGMELLAENASYNERIEEYPTPPHIIRALKHPFRGGLCSGK